MNKGNIYLGVYKNIERSLKEILEENDNFEENFRNFTEIISNCQISENNKDLKLLLFMIISISNNLYRRLYFFSKIEKILLFLKSKIKQHCSNIEIFDIFKTSKLLLLILFENEILNVEIQIIHFFFKEEFIKSNYMLFFHPEIKQFLQNNLNFENEQIIQYDSNNDLFLNKRKIGENDNLICQIIRNDKIKEFIDFTNKEKIDFSSLIPQFLKTIHSY